MRPSWLPSRTPPTPQGGSSRARVAVASLSLSAATLVGIALHEGYRDTAYHATADEKARGINTIGFGTTMNVQPGQRTTPERALVMLLNDATRFEQAVKRCAPVPMHPYEFAAYVGLTYNIGEGAFCRSTLAKHLNAGRYEQACAEILKWDKQSGRVLPGLTKRRQQEYRLCIGEDL